MGKAVLKGLEKRGNLPHSQMMRNPQDSPENRKARGTRIRWARELVEPSRLDFARKLGIDVSTIRYIEDGKSNPGVHLTHQLCHSLRISLDYIVEGRLTGVDPELAGLLVAHHPELTPLQRLARKNGSRHTDGRSSTSPNSSDWPDSHMGL